MPIIDMFAYVALAYLAIATIDKFYNNRPSWKDSLYMLFLLIVAGAVFVFTKDMAVTIVKNNVANLFFGNQTGYTAHLLYCALIVATTGIAWHGLLKYIVKPSSRGSKFFLAIASAMIGLSYLSSALNDLAVKYNISNADHFLYFCVGLIVVISAIALYFFRKEIQEVLAIVLGGSIVYGVYVYGYFQYYGINLLDKAQSAGHAGGGAIITGTLMFLYAVIWYRKKPWYERRSYKIFSFFAIIAMIWSSYLSLAYVGGALDPYQWQATQDENLAAQTIDKRQAEKLTNSIINGYTRAQAMTVINDPLSSDQEVTQAMQSIKLRRAKQAERVLAKPMPKSTVNTDRVAKGLSWIGDKASYVWDHRFWKNWGSGKSKNGATDKITKTKIYPPGTYTIYLKAGETTDHWIAFRDGKKYDYNISSKDDRFITTFYDGRSFNTWEITRFPYTRHVKIKLTAVTDQVITLRVT